MSSSLPSTAIAVVVQRSPKNPQQLQFAVSAQIPRKRTSAEDTVQYKLQHWLFWDDKRNFSHFDSLLTRLAPLSVVHLGCTERAEVRNALLNLLISCFRLEFCSNAAPFIVLLYGTSFDAY
jgi:hypothetical protein